jgi:hypothetical protein
MLPQAILLEHLPLQYVRPAILKLGLTINIKLGGRRTILPLVTKRRCRILQFALFEVYQSAGIRVAELMNPRPTFMPFWNARDPKRLQ